MSRNNGYKGSVSDTDPMTSTNNPWIYLNRCIPPGQTESQPSVFGLGFITEGDRQHGSD